MPNRYIITLMAANRVGILSAITTALAELGGDLVEVSQTVLQKYFTIILAADFPEHREGHVILDHIRDVCRPFGIEVSMKIPAEDVLQDVDDDQIEKCFLTVTGQDEPGMMREVASRLSQEGIDITDLYARRQDGNRSFVMVMELAVPIDIDRLSLAEDLEKMGDSVGLSASLQHENIFLATNDPRPVQIRMPK